MVRILFMIALIPLSFSGISQTLEFSGLTKLASANSKAEESMPLLSPDQTRLFFVRSFYEGNMGGKYSGQDIWSSQKNGSGWSAPTNKFELLNDKNNNTLIGISQDGKIMYTLNSSPAVRIEGLYFTRMNDRGWSRPEFVPLPGIDNQDFVGMFVSPDYDVIFLSMKGTDTRGEEDLYVSVKDGSGNWGKPKNIGATINTSGFEISPFLSADKKRLYFSSNGHGGFGDADVFYSERLYNSWETWSAPINLGDLVNSSKFDAYFSIYGDSVAFFSSNRDQQFSDIYAVKVSVKNNLLTGGQQYLGKNDWNSIIGKNIPHKITFDNKANALTASQKEFLYYMANKLAEKKEIGIHLVVVEEEDQELTRTRLREIYGELRQAGIDSERIKEEQRPETIVSSKRGVVEIRLFK
jgi:hypothetical protein